AMMDSLPLVIFTGQVASKVIGTDAFQEADDLGVTTPITKYNYQVDNIADFPRVVSEAFYIAATGRRGPVVVYMRKIMSEKIKEKIFERDLYVLLYQPAIKPNAFQVIRLSVAIVAAKPPVIVAGAAVLEAEAVDDLLYFID